MKKEVKNSILTLLYLQPLFLPLYFGVYGMLRIWGRVHYLIFLMILLVNIIGLCIGMLKEEVIKNYP